MLAGFSRFRAGAYKRARTRAKSTVLEKPNSRSDASASRVLLVEDERSIRDLVSKQLQRAGYNCFATGDGRDGLRLALEEHFDVIVLDLTLPNVDGMTICRTVRRQGVNQASSILMLTTRRAEADKVEGLQSGADDYVTKPFGVAELTARVEALARRVRRARTQAGAASRRVCTANGVELDPARHTVRVGGIDVALTPHEFELLYHLASQPGVAFTRDELLAAVWPWPDRASVTERNIDTLVRYLRRKVEQDPASPCLIVTVWGYGYKFADA
jgi:DNA-binding response OmpR family regulator